MNFEIAVEEWKIYVAKRHKKQSLDTLIKRFEKNILPYFIGKDIYNLSKTDYILWQNEIINHNFKNSYNQLLHSCFSQFLSFCQLYYNLEYNIAKMVGAFPRKIEQDSHDFYTLKEFKKFIKYVDNNIYKQYFNLLYFTGLRPSEAMALQFNDLKGDYITIKHNIHRKGKRLLDTPKNVSSIRTIKIDRKLKKDLVKLKKTYLKVYDNYNENYFIFGGCKPLAPTTIDRYKKIACEKAQIKCITQHQFRSSHATLLIEKGIPINEVSRRLGHSKISTTLDIYVRKNLCQEKRAIAVLNLLRF